MGSVEEHYQNLLAANYTWMSGGLEQKVEDNRRFFESLNLKVEPDARGLDLGCGSGFQTLALAALGFDVVAIDSSSTLIDELQQHTTGHRVTAIVGDLRDETLYADRGPFDLIVCMGDTLVHLPSIEDVTACFKSIARHLQAEGTLVLGFRDLTMELKGTDRAIPVRLDDDRLMSTFLEYEPEHVVVNDMIFTRENGAWTMHKSAYRKLRLSVHHVVSALTEIGLHAIEHSTERGFTTIVAMR